MIFERCLILVLLITTFSGQILSQRIVKTYSKGDGLTLLNDGLGKLEKETHYDSLGNITLELVYNSAYCLNTNTSYSYDNKNRVLEKRMITYYTMQNDSPMVVVLKYDYQDSLLLSIKTYHNEVLHNEKHYSYSKDGILSAEKWTNLDARSVVKSQTTQYNTAGLPTKVESVLKDGNLNQSWYYQYDSNMLLLQDSLMSHQSRGYSSRIYTYNDDKLKTHTKINSFNGESISTQFIFYTYDSNGFLLTEKWVNENDSTLRSIVYKHDSLGREILRHDGYSKRLHYYNDSGDLVRTYHENTKRDTLEIHDYSYANNGKRTFRDYRLIHRSNTHYLHKSTSQKVSPSGLLLSEQPYELPNTGKLPWTKHYTYNSLGQMIRFNHRYENKREREYDHNLPPDIEGQKNEQTIKLSDHFTWYNYNSKNQLVSCQKQADAPRLILKTANGFYLFEKSDHNSQFLIAEGNSQIRKKKIISSLDTIKVVNLNDGGQKNVIKYSFEKTPEMEQKGQIPYQDIIRTEVKTHDGGIVSIEEEWKGFTLHSYQEGKIQQLHYFVEYSNQGNTRFVCHPSSYEINAKFHFQDLSTIQSFPLELDHYTALSNFYFSNGQLIKQVSEPKCGQTGEILIHEYYSNKKLKRTRYYDANGRLKQTKEYIYQNGKLVKEYVIVGGGNVSFNNTISYQ